MRLGPTWVMTQSIVYSFSHIFPWFFVIVGALGSIFLTLLYDKYVPVYSGVEYWYELIQTIFSVWWYIAVSKKVLAHLRGESCLVGHAMKDAVKKTASMWWLVAWLTLLQWATVPLLQRPYCYGENIDLFAFLFIMLILVFQLFLNFSILPSIAAGELSFKKLYINALDFVRRQFAGLLYFFLLVAVVWGGLMLLMSFFVFLFKGMTECVIMLCWQPEVAKIVIISLATSTVTLFLAIAQTIFYNSQQGESAKWG